MAYAFDLWGWYAGEVPAGTERSTAATPPSFSTADTPAEPRANWTGSAWVLLPYVAPPPAPPTTPVPQAVTMRQARLALLGAGLLDDVEAAIDAIADPAAKAAARITWDHSQEVQRNNGLVSQLAPALGLTGDQLDDLFRTAAGL